MEAAVEPPAAEASRPKKRTGTSKYDFVKVKVWLGESRSHYYVLSRFLISRMLTLSKIPYIKAVKIALEVKKYLVDHSMLDVTQEELERILLQLITAKGLGTQYIDCYKMVTHFFQQRQPLIIVICGTAWTGKSTLAQQLASRINIPNVMQTDVIHELLQAQPGSGLAPGGLCQRPGLEGAALVEEFQRECTIVRRGMDGDFIKTLSSGKPLIVEGLHLDPGTFIQEFERLGLVMLPARTSRSSAASPAEADTPRPSRWAPVQDSTSSGAAAPVGKHDHASTEETQFSAAATTTAAAASCGSGSSDPSGHRSDQSTAVAGAKAAAEAVMVAAEQPPTPPAAAIPAFVAMAAAAAAGLQSHRLPTIHEGPDATISPEVSAGGDVAAAPVTSGPHLDTYTPPVSPGVPLVAADAQGPPLWQPVLPAGAGGDGCRQPRVPGLGPYPLNTLDEGWGILGPPMLPRATSSARDAACLSREHSTTEVVSREDSFASNEEEEEEGGAGSRLEGQAVAGCEQSAACSSSGTSSRQQGRTRRSRRGAGGRDTGGRALDSSNISSRAAAEQLLAPVLQFQQAAASERLAARAQRRQAQPTGSGQAAQGSHGSPAASCQQDSTGACLGSAAGSLVSDVHLTGPGSQQAPQQQQDPQQQQQQQQSSKQLPPMLQVQEVPAGVSGEGGRSQQPLFVPVVLCMDPADHIMVAEEALAHLVLPHAASSNPHHSPASSVHQQEAGGNNGSAGAVDSAPHGSAAADPQLPSSGGAPVTTAAAATAAVAACPPAGPAAPDVVQQAVQRAQRLQAYLCSFEAQGLPIVKLSYGCFGEALDKLHEYVLQCIKVAMQWDSSAAPSTGAQP